MRVDEANDVCKDSSKWKVYTKFILFISSYVGRYLFYFQLCLYVVLFLRRVSSQINKSSLYETTVHMQRVGVQDKQTDLISQLDMSMFAYSR